MARRPYGRGNYGRDVYGSGIRQPRGYGMGPYGLGPYGPWAEHVHEPGAATSIRFVPAAKPTMVFVANAAATSIRFAPMAWPAMVWDRGAVTRIEFRLQGALVHTWQDVGPCKVGEWSIAA